LTALPRAIDAVRALLSLCLDYIGLGERTGDFRRNGALTDGRKARCEPSGGSAKCTSPQSKGIVARWRYWACLSSAINF